MAVGFVAPRRASVPSLSIAGRRQQALRKRSAAGASNRQRCATHSAVGTMPGASAARRERTITEGEVQTFPSGFEHVRSRVSSFSSSSMSRRGSVSSEGSVESTSESILSVASLARRPSWLLPQTPDEYSDWCSARTGDASFNILVSSLLASQGFVASATDERRYSESNMQHADTEFLNSIPATPEARYCHESSACLSFFIEAPMLAGQLDDPAAAVTRASDLSSLGEITTPDEISTPSEAGSDDVSDCSSSSSDVSTLEGEEFRLPKLMTLQPAPIVESNNAQSSVAASSRASCPSARPALRSTALPFVPFPFVPIQQPQVVSEPSRNAFIASAQVSPALQQNKGAMMPRVTTVMLRNMPQKYTREMLLDDMDARGFKGTFDFLYLPVDFKTKLCAGYAFINFTTEAEYAHFSFIYQGLKLNSNSPKVCEAQPAKKQGKDCNVAFYRNNAVMALSEEYHPLVFEDGVRKLFPKPTQPVEAHMRNNRKAA